MEDEEIRLPRTTPVDKVDRRKAPWDSSLQTLTGAGGIPGRKPPFQPPTRDHTHTNPCSWDLGHLYQLATAGSRPSPWPWQKVSSNSGFQGSLQRPRWEALWNESRLVHTGPEHASCNPHASRPLHCWGHLSFPASISSPGADVSWDSPPGISEHVPGTLWLFPVTQRLLPQPPPAVGLLHGDPCLPSQNPILQAIAPRHPHIPLSAAS